MTELINIIKDLKQFLRCLATYSINVPCIAGGYRMRADLNSFGEKLNIRWKGYDFREIIYG